MASQNKSNEFEDVQIGLLEKPAEIIKYTTKFAKADTKSVTCRAALFDSETAATISLFETRWREKCGRAEFTLDSVLSDDTLTAEDGREYYVLRTKMTRDEGNFITADEYKGDFPPPMYLSQLVPGHQFVAKARMVTWTYKNKCGISIYLNYVMATGKSNDPLDDSKQESSEVAGSHITKMDWA